MRQHHSRRQSLGHQSWAAEMTRAAGCFCLVLLLAPTVIEARHPSRGRGRQLPRSLANSTKRAASWCDDQVSGCTVCYEETPTIASGAQFPGMDQPPVAETIVRCTRCKLPAYIYSKDMGNCDCGSGYGTAFANGTLISVDSFEPTKLPTSLSDTMTFPVPAGSNSSKGSSSSSSSSSSTDDKTSNKAAADKSSSSGGSSSGGSSSGGSSTGNKAGAGAAGVGAAGVGAAGVGAAGVGAAGVGAGASVASFAEANESGTQRGDTTPLRRLQPAARRRRFETYMRNQGYNVRTSRKGTFISQVKTSFSSAEPVGVEGVPEQPLICVACKGNTFSDGGLIGGSFCMPCEPGTVADSSKGSCNPQQ